jgi:UDP-N-acetylglucosamine acyltransferase
VNSEGLKRRGFNEEQIRSIRESYRILYRMDLKLAEAMEKLRAMGATDPNIKMFADFVAASTRSIVR